MLFSPPLAVISLCHLLEGGKTSHRPFPQGSFRGDSGGVFKDDSVLGFLLQDDLKNPYYFSQEGGCWARVQRLIVVLWRPS